MFGYVVLNKPEIKFKDFDLYRSFYCGLCRELKEKYGISGQISLTYDMTFVVILLSALYEPDTKKIRPGVLFIRFVNNRSGEMKLQNMQQI